MPSIFLSHTKADKPFVEKLAKDLTRLGVNVWYDNWSIGVGESILWKIDEGIRENEYLGIVLSNEALNSEWVKSELSAGWTKQMAEKKVVVLPILYRDCPIPLFLKDRKYADFRNDYEQGLGALCGPLGIPQLEVISIENWRKFMKVKNVNWRKYKIEEFEKLVTKLVDMAIEYNWSSWVGKGQNPFSITFSGNRQSISIKLSGKNHAYMASLKETWNPNRLKVSDFNIYVGNTINECEEFVWRYLEDCKNKYGKPNGRPMHSLNKQNAYENSHELALELVNKLRWYKGNKI